MPVTTKGGTGGPGLPYSITGITQTYAGGGGGTDSFGGIGGGGAGSTTGPGGDATYYGSGGGGTGAVAGTAVPGGNGYQGIFILSYPISFATSSGATPSLTSSSPFTFNTSTIGQTFTIYQSATNTGPITWSYDTLPNGVTLSSTDITQVTFGVAQYSTAVLQTFNVTASGQYGSTTLPISYQATGNVPTLTSSSPYTFATSTAGQTLTVTQSATGTGPITWSYSSLPSGLSFSSSSGSQIVFAVAQFSSASTQTFTVTGSCPYGQTTVIISYTAAP
jgi:hypothetical protein